jgi:Tol biopolymer transport system component
MAKSGNMVAAGAVLALTLLAWPAAAQAHVVESISGGGMNAATSASVSADGRYVAYRAADISISNVYLRDRVAGSWQLVASGENGGPGDPSVSADGHFVAYWMVRGGPAPHPEIFVYDATSETAEAVSLAADGSALDGGSTQPSISADGRYVAFTSAATGLVAGDGNGCTDVFVHDRETGVTTRVSVGGAGAEAHGDSSRPSISADGRYVAFESLASDLVADDTNGVCDVFVHDRQTGSTTLVSVTPGGAGGNGPSSDPSISADGRSVAFESLASDLIPGDTNGISDVFVHDRQTGSTTLVSVTPAGAGGNGPSSDPSISGDGRRVAFESAATDLVADDTNGVSDVFVRDRDAAATIRVSVAQDGTEGDLAGSRPCISADGQWVAFDSAADNLAPGDTNEDRDVFLASVDFTVQEPVAYVSLRGTDRYHTAILVSRAAFPDALPAGSGLVLAPGETFQEALCGGPLAAAYGGPVLLTPKSGLDGRVKAEILRLKPAYVICIGLSDSVKDAVQRALGASGTASVIRGWSVYAMSRNVALALKARVGSLSGATAIITRGDRFPDAIAVSSLACANKWPILLTGPGTTLSAYAYLTLGQLDLTRAIKVGTYAVLPSVVTAVTNLSGADRYHTNRNVAEWAKANAGLRFTHLGITTGDKFPDALAAGPYLGRDAGILLLDATGGMPPVIAAELSANAGDVRRLSLIALPETSVGEALALMP